jgi:hypothetical protein
MIYCYPTIQGKKTKCYFYENWDEVPISAFVKWQKIASELEVIEKQYKELAEQLKEVAEKMAVALFNGKPIDVLQKQKQNIERRLAPIAKEKAGLEIEGIACFTDVPIECLATMTIVDRREDDEQIELWDADNCLDAYKARLFNLASCKLPQEAQASFVFQTRTDEEIEVLLSKYKKLGFLGRLLLPKAYRLRKELKAAMYGVYQVKDIWVQTTFANKEMQDNANVIVEQIKKGDFSGIVYLIAMMTVEGQSDEQILHSIRNDKAAVYLEKYKEAFIQLYRKREQLFTQSKNQLSVATLIRIKNFFLSS